MWGFGAPDDFLGSNPWPGHYDWGFGDPEPDNWDAEDSIDWGFGDPPPGDLLVAFLASTALLPDDGGEVVRLTATWPTLGPYRIRLKQHFTGQTFPDTGEQWGAAAPLAFDDVGRVETRETPWACYTTIKPRLSPADEPPEPGRILRFVLPVVPTGLYDVEIAWGESWEEELVLESALRVIYRGRSEEQWRVRSLYPELYTVGARGPRLEELLEGGEET